MSILQNTYTYLEKHYKNIGFGYIILYLFLILTIIASIVALVVASNNAYNDCQKMAGSDRYPIKSLLQLYGCIGVAGPVFSVIVSSILGIYLKDFYYSYKCCIGCIIIIAFINIIIGIIMGIFLFIYADDCKWTFFYIYPLGIFIGYIYALLLIIIYLY